MQLRFLNAYFRKISVDCRNGDIEGLWKKSELSVNIDDPLNKKSSWCVLDLILYLLNVLIVNCVVRFQIYHWLIDLLSELSYVLWISHVKLVRKRQCLFELLLAVIYAFLAFQCNDITAIDRVALIIRAHCPLCGRVRTPAFQQDNFFNLRWWWGNTIYQNCLELLCSLNLDGLRRLNNACSFLLGRS